MSIGTYNQYPFVWDGTRRVNPNDWNNAMFNITGSQIKSGSFEVDGPVYISGSLTLSGSTNIGLAATLNVQNSGVIEGARSTINLLSGSGINLVVTDNPSNNSVDISIGTGSGVGSGGVQNAYTTVQNQGSAIPQRNTIDFIGTTVQATDDSSNSRTTVTLPSYGVSNPSSVTIGASASPGANTAISRSDHTHGSPSSWTPGLHASTHVSGGTDPITGSLTLTSLTTGNITSNILTSTGSISTSGNLTFTGSLSGSGQAFILNTLQTSGLATFLGGVVSTGSNTLVSILANSTVITGSFTGSTMTAGNLTTNNITSTGSVIAPTITVNTDIITGSSTISSLTAGVTTLSKTTITGSLTINSGSNITILSGSLVVNSGSGNYIVISGSTAPLGRINSFGRIDYSSGISTNLVTGSVIQVNVKFGAPSDSDFTNPIDGLLVVDNQHNTLWERASGAWIQVTGSSGTGSLVAHNILSATHTDTVPAAVSRGDLITGNSTPAWNRLPIGTVGQVVGSTGVDTTWTGSLNVQTGSKFFGNQNTINFLTGSPAITITGSSSGGIANLVFNTGSTVATLLSGSLVVNSGSGNYIVLVPTNELGTGTATAAVFLRGDATWSTPPTGVTNVRYASIFASAGAGTSGSPWTGWDNVGTGVFANMPALPQPVTVIFEPGWFQAATGSVPINRSYVSIGGYGPESVIQFPGYGTGLTWGGITGSGNPATGSYSQIAVSGLHLIGSNQPDLSGSYQIGLFLGGTYDFWISGTWTELFGLTGSPTVAETQGAGIYVGSGSKRGHIFGNRASKNKIAGISISGNNGVLNDFDYTEDIEVTGNLVDFNHSNGIHLLNDVRGITVTSNICRGNEEAGIALENLSGQNENFAPKFCTVEGNTCYRNTRSAIGGGSAQGGYGISLYGAQDCIVIGNSCNETSGSGTSDASTGVGIRVLADSSGIAIARRNLISNNTVENNQGSGIRLETNNSNFGPTNTTITNNVVNGNGLSGAGLGIDFVSAGSVANSGSILTNNYLYTNTVGSIIVPAGLISSSIKDNVGYNPIITGSQNFVTTVATTKNGVPTDTDFYNPQDGQLAVNTSTNSIYFRSNASWRTVTGGGGSTFNSLPFTYIIYTGSASVVNALNAQTNNIDFSGTSASTVIGSALSAMSGGTLHIKNGTYGITSPITIPQTTGMIIEGEGLNTILQQQANLGDRGILTSGSNTPSKVTIRNLYFDGNNGGGFSGSAINCWMANFDIQNCRFRNWSGNIIYVWGTGANFSFYNRVTGCKFEASSAKGIWSRFSDSNLFENNVFDGILQENIHSSSGTDNLINNMVNINPGAGNAATTPVFRVANPNSVVVGNNIGGDTSSLTGGIGIGILFDAQNNAGSNCIICNNTITNSQQAGIYITGGASNVNISHNQVLGASRSSSGTFAGIFLDSSTTACVINGNIIDGSAAGKYATKMGNGITESSGGNNNIITSNIVRSALGTPISTVGGSDVIANNITGIA